MFQNIIAVKAALLHEFSRRRVLVVGDVMLDKYLWGTASRISPEAPVPVMRLQRRSWTLGGAANVASNLAALGVAVDLAGFVGHDGDARLLCEECVRLSVGTQGLLTIEDFATTSKTRVLAEDRQLLRIDEEVTTPCLQTNADRLLEIIRAGMEAALPAAVVISDYAKGLCTPYFCQQLIGLCRERGVPVFVDPKGIDYAKYAGATAVKPNRSEIAEVAQALGWEWQGPVPAAQQLLEFLDLDFVAVTLAAQGMVVVQRDEIHEMPTVAREVYDVSGAGDTVIATLVAALVSGINLLDSAALANIAAAEVVARIGSTPIAREDLLVAVQAQNRVTSSRKLYELEEVQTLMAAWRKSGLKVALTNGCFDLLHAGHVRLLEDSAAECDRLIVALNSDASISHLKGPERPLMPEAQRVAVLPALECVDAVVVFEQDTPIKVIEAVRPDRLIKGGDYTVNTVVGAELVQSYGGEVVLVPLVKNISTSHLANAISRL